MNFRKNVITKKLWRYCSGVPRAVRLLSAEEGDYQSSPPALVNSFPKSGTHLLLQIIEVLGEFRDFGNFCASQPSFTFKERSSASLSRQIGRLLPQEVFCGHVFYSRAVENALQAKNVVHYFIYRDPRDVAVSETHYLTEMNRWHRMHREYKKLPTPTERLLLSVCGLVSPNLDYPNIGQRFERFCGWINNPQVCAVSYEDLVSDKKIEAIRKIVTFYRDRVDKDIPVDELVEKSVEAIEPSRSHTFRKGGSGGWRNEFDDRVKAAFKEVAGDLIVRLGYEKSYDW